MDTEHSQNTPAAGAASILFVDPAPQPEVVKLPKPVDDAGFDTAGVGAELEAVVGARGGAAAGVIIVDWGSTDAAGSVGVPNENPELPDAFEVLVVASLVLFSPTD